MLTCDETPTTSSVFRASLSRTSWNIAVGTAVFGFVLLLIPAAPPSHAVPTLVAALIAAVCARSLAVRSFRPPPPVVCHGRILRKPLSVILIGSSLVAVLWSSGGIPWLALPIALGFLSRWILYVLEIQDVRLCDLRKIGLPPLATRVRLWITLITGALIPALILLGAPASPLLLLSFVLTGFSQWSVTCELALNPTLTRISADWQSCDFHKVA
jgi:hypothetical protein